MNSKQTYFILLGLIGLLLLALLGGAYGADVLLVKQSQQLVGYRQQMAVLDQEQQELVSAKQTIKKYQSLATIADSVVPQDKDQAQTVRQIVDIANANGVALGSILFPTSTLGSSTAGQSSGSGSLTQLTPVTGIPGVYSLQLAVQSDGANPVPYTNFINFLSGLEHNRRTALVSSITITPNPKDRTTISFTLQLNEYIKP